MKLSISPKIVLLVFLFPWIGISQNPIHQDEAKWMKNWTNFDPNQTYYPEADEILPNIIDKDYYLSNSKVYLLSGNTYVSNNAKLTIEEGTIIRCDHQNSSTLVITKGAQLIARGTVVKPIIFTSDKPEKSRTPGDWGGIVIAGGGTVNSPSGMGVIEGNFDPLFSTYGGNTPDEITTILSYVRIEYAGKKINMSKELNGVSLYAAGKNSLISNIMVSYSADDSFEFFGGEIEASNLISYKAKDDDFDFTEGHRGRLNTILAIRHPYISDISGSYAIEIDGYNKNQGIISSEKLTNVSIESGHLINLSDKSNYQHTTAAISSRHLGQLKLTNSRISGFSNVVSFDKSYTNLSEIQKSFSLENSLYNVHGDAVMASFQPNSSAEQLLKYNMHTTHFKNVQDFFTDPLNSKFPIFTLKDSLGSYTVMQ